jgi:hypothetical protein
VRKSSAERNDFRRFVHIGKMSGDFSAGSGAEVVRHPIELGGVPMDRLLAAVRALLAAAVPAGLRTTSCTGKEPSGSLYHKSRHFLF